MQLTEDIILQTEVDPDECVGNSRKTYEALQKECVVLLIPRQDNKFCVYLSYMTLAAMLKSAAATKHGVLVHCETCYRSPEQCAGKTSITQGHRYALSEVPMERRPDEQGIRDHMITFGPQCHLYNPFFQIPSPDPHKITAVEVLHTFSLGPMKYLTDYELARRMIREKILFQRVSQHMQHSVCHVH